MSVGLSLLRPSISYSLAHLEINFVNIDKTVKTQAHVHKGLIGFLKTVICYNQGQLAQHGYLISKKHQAMKEAIQRKEAASVILERKQELDDYANTRLLAVCRRNFGFIKEYFIRRGDDFPARICIKVNDLITAPGTPTITSLFREAPQNDRTYGTLDYSIDANTGFKSVFETGLSFFNNDIPKAIREKRPYLNPRLEHNRVLEYKPRWFRKKGKPDDKWCDCWRSVTIRQNGNPVREERPTPQECYKATVVIPMTLLNNVDMDPEFQMKFGINPNTPGRSIYGYLCFDSHQEGYFDPHDDIFIGYMFADILSLFFVTNLCYTDVSSTYKRVRG